MSDDRQAEVMHATPGPDAIPEPVPSLPEPEPMPALPAPTRHRLEAGADRLFNTYQRNLASIGQSQTALVADAADMALEMTGLARANLTAAGDGVTALFAAKSFTEAVEIQLGFARRSLDAIANGSMRLGEIGIRLVNDAAKPMLGTLSAG